MEWSSNQGLVGNLDGPFVPRKLSYLEARPMAYRFAVRCQLGQTKTKYRSPRPKHLALARPNPNELRYYGLTIDEIQRDVTVHLRRLSNVKRFDRMQKFAK